MRFPLVRSPDEVELFAYKIRKKWPLCMGPGCIKPRLRINVTFLTGTLLGVSEPRVVSATPHPPPPTSAVPIVEPSDELAALSLLTR